MACCHYFIVFDAVQRKALRHGDDGPELPAQVVYSDSDLKQSSESATNNDPETVVEDVTSKIAAAQQMVQDTMDETPADE